MPTPLEYANQYRDLTVYFSDGLVKVRIDRYHTGLWDHEADRLIDDAVSDFKKEKKKNSLYTLVFNVSGRSVAFRDENALRRCLHYAFDGKGSPEDCQVAAQIAVLRKRTTKEKLQVYCQDHMGLDCNGFVGNYLWYVRGSKIWPDSAPGANQGPNALIDDIVLRGTPVANLASLKPDRLNIFALLDNKFRIVPRDGAEHAHIVISEPGRFTASSFVTDSFGGLDPYKGIWGHPGLWCVEATGPQHKVGLRDGWYALTEILPDKKTKNLQSVHGHPAFKAFRVYRAIKDQWLNFTIASLPVS